VIKMIKKILDIKCENNDEKVRIGKMIHEQLLGNKDYKENNIVLNIEGDNEVCLYIYEEVDYKIELKIEL